MAELPVCAKPIGTLALSEPENSNRWWTELGLSSPESLIRVYVQKSKCFRLVNRSNRGMAAMQQERVIAALQKTHLAELSDAECRELLADLTAMLS